MACNLERLAATNSLIATLGFRIRDMLDITKPYGPPKFAPCSAAVSAYYNRKHEAIRAGYYRQFRGAARAAAVEQVWA